MGRPVDTRDAIGPKLGFLYCYGQAKL